MALAQLLLLAANTAGVAAATACPHALAHTCFHDKGAIAGHLPGAAADECCAACAANATCAGWTQWVDDGEAPQCNLFSTAPTNKVPGSGCTSGYGPAAPPPPPPPPPPAPPCKGCPNILLMFTVRCLIPTPLTPTPAHPPTATPTPDPHARPLRRTTRTSSSGAGAGRTARSTAGAIP